MERRRAVCLFRDHSMVCMVWSVSFDSQDHDLLPPLPPSLSLPPSLPLSCAHHRTRTGGRSDLVRNFLQLPDELYSYHQVSKTCTTAVYHQGSKTCTTDVYREVSKTCTTAVYREVSKTCTAAVYRQVSKTAP